MGRDLYEGAPETRRYFEQAAAYEPGLLDVMFQGEPETLAKTRYAQLALLTVEASLCHVLFSRGINPQVCAGHSLGEFSALFAAGALRFEEVLRLVDARSRLMTELVPPGGMAAVLGLPHDRLEQALPEGAYVANYNGPDQTIISGTHEAIKLAEESLKQAGAKRVMPLQVSGPFHSPLMTQARDAFAEVVGVAEISDPIYPFVSSVSGERVSDAGRIRELLANQICAPVQWTRVMSTIGAVPALEVGPGRVLQGLCKRMPGAPEPVFPVGTLEACQTLEADH